MIYIKEYFLTPIYKVLAGTLTATTLLILSPILFGIIVYILFYSDKYLEYLNPDLSDLYLEEGE